VSSRARKAPAEKPAPTTPSFPVVGIGASAGGLKAVELFLEAMPKDDKLGMAFVLVQHLDPDHRSVLLDLIRQYTSMPVAWAEDGDALEPDHFYAMPPNKDIAVMDGRLRLMEPEAPRGLRLPIDGFLRSLAAERRELSAAIILSGTGSDGTIGLRAVKGEGGLAMAQAPESAEYDGMPRNAIATGLVDYVLKPGEMPGQLAAYARRAFVPRPPAHDTPTDEESITRILVLLRERTTHDFAAYKRNTVRRRIERRMVVTQVENLAEYAKYIAKDAAECDVLFRELLIGVTSFFRDPEAFETLAAKAIPDIVSRATADQPIRVWVPGCSTGEEAYAIAILFQEHVQELRRNLPLQIFATDIDAEAVERARAGLYPDSIAADVSAERLGRFFTHESGAYRVHKSLRDLIVFAEQDLCKDPPFSHLDLVSCRNLLIYLGGDLQQRVVPLFHYALNERGYLFLGTSESVGDAQDLFAPVAKKAKIYRRRAAATRVLRTLTLPAPHQTGITSARASQHARQQPSLRDITERSLLTRHTPAAAVVGADGNVLFIHGRTGRFLEPASGEASPNLVYMAREGLRRELAAGIRRVVAKGEPVVYQRLHVKTNGDVALVDLRIEQMEPNDYPQKTYLVTFTETPLEVASEATAGVATGEYEQRIADLERELTSKEEYVQTAMEELETSNEELKSMNEELQSSNEELQSSNEELETSKEELQSVNEELVTVNAELQQKLEELSQANNDMNNLLAGTGIGTVFVDHQLRIQRFTPAATKIINLIQTDAGRPISDIVSRLDAEQDLVGDIQEVLDTLTVKEAEVRTAGGGQYLMRIQPYRTVDNVIEGAVITFVDVSSRPCRPD
jgi:two-component system, chemotaxis family, CheB/CheR fusion protein